MDRANLTQMPDGWKEHTYIYSAVKTKSRWLPDHVKFLTFIWIKFCKDTLELWEFINCCPWKWHNWNLTQVALTLFIYHNQWEINQHYVCGFQVTGLVVKSLWHKASFGPEHTCNTVSHNAMCLTWSSTCIVMDELVISPWHLLLYLSHFYYLSHYADHLFGFFFFFTKIKPVLFNLLYLDFIFTLF